MATFESRHMNVYVLKQDSGHFSTVYQQVRHILNVVLTHNGFLLWEWKGMYSIVPHEVIENALTDGCSRPDIFWDQCVPVPQWLVRRWLKHTEELPETSESSEPAPGSEGNDSQA